MEKKRIKKNQRIKGASGYGFVGGEYIHIITLSGNDGHFVALVPISSMKVHQNK